MSLWYVSKGLAAAPPGMMFIIGVSTSVKSLLIKYCLMKLMTFDLVLNLVWID
jgi:hypothetical protein